MRRIFKEHAHENLDDGYYFLYAKEIMQGPRGSPDSALR